MVSSNSDFLNEAGFSDFVEIARGSLSTDILFCLQIKW